MSEPFVLEIRRGTGDPRSLTLEVGQELPPLSIGSGADWRIDADGMEEVHAFVYFDGQQLHVQSAVPARPVKVNGRAVGTEWTPVAAPSTLAVADARLVFCPLSQASAAATGSAVPRSRTPTPFGEDAPTRMQLPAAHDDDEATGHIEVPNFDEEATRALPVPQAAKMMAARRPTPAPGGSPAMAPPGAPPIGPPMAAPPMAAPVLGLSAAPVMGPDLLGPPAYAPPPPPPPPPDDVPPHLQTTTKPALRTDENKLAKAWRETSLVKKATLVLLPLAFVMVIFGFEDDPAPTKAKSKPAASASSSSTAADDDPPKKKKPKKQDDDDPAPGPSATAPAPAPTPSSSHSGPAPVPPGPAPSASASAPGSPKTDPAKKSAEREAVDAVAAGQYELAAKLYDQLAKEHPDVPAYKEAARILRAKAKK